MEREDGINVPTEEKENIGGLHCGKVIIPDVFVSSNCTHCQQQSLHPRVEAIPIPHVHIIADINIRIYSLSRAGASYKENL